MATTLEIWRTGAGAYTDYTSWLWGSDNALFAKRHRVNEPQELEFTLQDGVAGFQAPEAGNRIKLTTDAYGVTFVGYLFQTPKKEPAAQGPTYLYRCQARSEEIRLEWHRASKFNTLPPFLNKNQGDIIKELIAILGGGLTTTNVDNGILIPYFRVRPEETFTEVVQRLSDKTNMKFWTANGAAFYKAFNDSAFTPAPDTANSQYLPADLEIRPMLNPVFNDVLAVGAIEPQGYVRENFVADGFTGEFPLKLPLFGAESSKLLEDDFTGTAIDSNRWTETDTDGILAVSANSLVLNGGATSAISRLTAKEGVEVAGKLELRAGRIRFDAASDCIIGGLFSSDTGALAQCVAGFRCTPSGGQTQIQSIASGTVTGPTYTTKADKTYQFLISVDVSYALRRRRQFNSLKSTFGGEDVTADARITFSVLELSDNEPDSPVAALSHSATIFSIAQFLLYTAIAGPVTLANSVNAKLNFCLLRKAISAELLTKKLADSDYVRRRLGDKADPLAVAAIIVGTEGHELKFFEDTIPEAKEKIEIIYRAAGQARARVRKDTSITSEASKAGDDGVRMGVLPELHPAPRDAAELERAAQAFIDDHTSAIYEGVWRFENKSYAVASEPLPGRFVTVTETSRYAQFDGFVTEVESAYILRDGSADVIEHAAHFGVISRLEQAQQQFATAENALQGALDTLADVASIEFNDVGTTFAADRPDADWNGTLTPTSLQIDTGAAPDSSYEVRKTDGAWGAGSTINRIAPTGSQFARPISDINNTGGWTPTSPTDLWDELDESSPDDDTTEVFSVENPQESDGTGFEVKLGAVNNPQSSIGHTIRVRAQPHVNGGKRLAFQYRLYQGTTAIGGPDRARAITWSGNAYLTFSYQLTAAEADSITDYSDLRVRVWGTTYGTGTASRIGITWIEFEVPAAPGSDPTTQTFSVIRSSRDTLAYIKNKDGTGKLSRYPSIIRVAVPLIPDSPGYSVNTNDIFKPQIVLSLPSDSQDVWGVEIRDSDNSTVLYRYQDATLAISPSDPNLTFIYEGVIPPTGAKILFGYTFNLLDEYSAPASIDLREGSALNVSRYTRRLLPNGDLDLWDSDSQPHDWTVDTTAGAVAARETATVFSGTFSLKYSNPDNATNGGWHGVDSGLRLPLRPGFSYTISLAGRTTLATGSLRMTAYFNAAQSLTASKTHNFAGANAWEVTNWVFTVPSNAEPLSQLLIEFNRNSDSNPQDFWIDSGHINEYSTLTTGPTLTAGGILIGYDTPKQTSGGPEMLGFNPSVSNRVIMGSWVGSGVNALFLASANGFLEWGAGGSADQDIAFFRNWPGGLTIGRFNADKPISTASRVSNVVTITMAADHEYVVGSEVVIAGVTPSSFNGTFAVATTPTSSTFTYAQVAADDSGTGGTATLNSDHVFSVHQRSLDGNLGLSLFRVDESGSNPRVVIENSTRLSINGAQGGAWTDVQNDGSGPPSFRSLSDTLGDIAYGASKLTGDTFNRINIFHDGTIGFGGGSAAADANIVRSVAGKLVCQGDSGFGVTKFTGDTHPRVIMSADSALGTNGQIWFGDGSANPIHGITRGVLPNSEYSISIIRQSGEINFRISPRAADPTTTGWGVNEKGTIWFQSTANELRVWDGSTVAAISGTPWLVSGSDVYYSGAGKVFFSSSKDTGLYRSTTGTLIMQGSVGMGAIVSGDTNPRLLLDTANKRLAFGPGNAAVDAFLTYASGALTLAAGGTNQNIGLTPSGTGQIRLNAITHLVGTSAQQLWGELNRTTEAQFDINVDNLGAGGARLRFNRLSKTGTLTAWNIPGTATVAMLLDAAGNLSFPGAAAARVDIQDSGYTDKDTLLRIQADDQNPWMIRLRQTAALQDWGVFVEDSDVLHIYDISDSRYVLSLDGSGNVGIGESVPDYKLDVNGSFGFTPGSSVTPVDNGDVVIEATSNTVLTFKLKGGDSTVRTGTITLS